MATWTTSLPDRKRKRQLETFVYSCRHRACLGSTAPDEASQTIAERSDKGLSLGADKAYDTADFVADCRARNFTAHVAQNIERRGGSAIDRRTTRHAGYQVSQVIRKRVEEHFGWGKTVGRIRQTVFRGLRRVDQEFKLTMAASNIDSIARILSTVPQGAAQ